MSMDLDDLWLRDGDERFARFLRRLGFDHDEARDLAEKTRPPWRGWDRLVPRRLLSKDDIRREKPIWNGTGWMEPPPRPPQLDVTVGPTAGHLRETAEPLLPSTTRAENPRFWAEMQKALEKPTGISEAVDRYRRNTTPGNYMPGPEYEGKPIIVSEERDMTEQFARGEGRYQ